MLEVVVPPLATAFVLFLAMVAVAVRRADRPSGVPSSERRRGRHLLGTTLGGYVAFLLIVLVFHVWIAGEPDVFGSAVAGGGFLALIALALSAATDAMTRRRSRSR